LEAGAQEVDPFWIETVDNGAWTSAESGALAAERIRAIGAERARIAVERSFLPVDAHTALAGALAGADLVEAHGILEELRAVKRPEELELLRAASDAIVASMLEAFGAARPGMTRSELEAEVRRGETERGLDFEYCLVSTGRSFNRAPTPRLRWEQGEACCLDSGGSLHGYVGDLARVAWMGEPPPPAVELRAEVDAVQQAARTAVAPGRPGSDVYAAALERVRASPHADRIEFVAHGMGLIAHEVPRLSSEGVVVYEAAHAERRATPTTAWSSSRTPSS
jgi:Xaa-Pro aminopeptidase